MEYYISSTTLQPLPLLLFWDVAQTFKTIPSHITAILLVTKTSVVLGSKLTNNFHKSRIQRAEGFPWTGWTLVNIFLTKVYKNWAARPIRGVKNLFLKTWLFCLRYQSRGYQGIRGYQTFQSLKSWNGCRKKFHWLEVINGQYNTMHYTANHTACLWRQQLCERGNFM